MPLLSTLGLTIPDLSSATNINEQIRLMQEAKAKITFTQNALIGSFLTTGVIQFTFSASRRADTTNSDRRETDSTIDPYNATLTFVYGTIMLAGTYVASQIRAYDLILAFLTEKKSTFGNDAISQDQINAYMHNHRLISNAVREIPRSTISYAGAGLQSAWARITAMIPGQQPKTELDHTSAESRNLLTDSNSSTNNNNQLNRS